MVEDALSGTTTMEAKLVRMEVGESGWPLLEGV
jgi:hypothetical protein